MKSSTRKDINTFTVTTRNVVVVTLVVLTTAFLFGKLTKNL